MSRRVFQWCALLLCLCAGGALEAALYEVPAEYGEVVGAWDANILADDVHFEVPSILREIRMPLAIRGVQNCQLWIFASMASAPIHTQAFSNRPALDEFDVSTYVFEMNLQVPKDIYVGFSAQGGGWTNTLSDYWSRGTVVAQGVPGTPGEYAYGTAATEQLSFGFVPGDGTFGCMEILSQPVLAAGMAVVTGQVEITFTSLPIYATNVVEGSVLAGGTNWQEKSVLPAGVSSVVWSAGSADSTTCFYRIRSR